MIRKFRAYGLLLTAIACVSAHGGDFKPFVGMELISSQPDTPIDQRDTLLNLGVDYKVGVGLSGGVDVGLREDSTEWASNSAVSVKTNLYAKYNWLAESPLSPFIMAGYTAARFNQRNCAEDALGNASFSLPEGECGSGHFNTFGTTYGIGLMLKGSRRNSSGIMVKYLKTTGMADLEMDTLGVSLIY